MNLERRPVLLPHLPVRSTPPSTPPPQNSPLSNSEAQQVRVNSNAASPGNAHPPVEENSEVQTKEPPPDGVALTEYTKLRLDSVGPTCSMSPLSVLSNGSLSGLSGPSSSVFTRSSQPSGWISGLSANQCQESNNRCRYPCPSSGGCGLTLPCYQHNSPTISNDFSSFVVQQIPGTRTQNASLSHHSSRVC